MPANDISDHVEYLNGKWLFFYILLLFYVFFLLLLTTFLQMPDASDDEAVRIFVEFEKIDSAIKGNR